MAISHFELESLLQEKFPESEITLTDIAGDEDHYSLIIIDSSFKDKSIIEQHRMVKDALKSVLPSKLHAITIKTVAR